MKCLGPFCWLEFTLLPVNPSSPWQRSQLLRRAGLVLSFPSEPRLRVPRPCCGLGCLQPAAWLWPSPGASVHHWHENSFRLSVVDSRPLLSLCWYTLLLSKSRQESSLLRYCVSEHAFIPLWLFSSVTGCGVLGWA